jgi:hypothetical protein
LKEAAAMGARDKGAGVAHAVWSTLEDTRLSFPLDGPRLKTLQGKYKVPHFDAKGEADAIFAAEAAPASFLMPSATGARRCGAIHSGDSRRDVESAGQDAASGTSTTSRGS